MMERFSRWKRRGEIRIPGVHFFDFSWSCRFHFYFLSGGLILTAHSDCVTSLGKIKVTVTLSFAPHFLFLQTFSFHMIRICWASKAASMLPYFVLSASATCYEKF